MFCLSCLRGECHIYQYYMIRGTSQILGSSMFSVTITSNVTLNTNTCSVLQFFTMFEDFSNILKSQISNWNFLHTDKSWSSLAIRMEFS